MKELQQNIFKLLTKKKKVNLFNFLHRKYLIYTKISFIIINIRIAYLNFIESKIYILIIYLINLYLYT